MSKHFYFDLGIYPFTIVVSVNETDECLFRYLKKFRVANLQHAVLCEKAYAKYVLWNNNVGLIRMRSWKKDARHISALSHEICHIVISVLREVGMKISNNCGSDEAYCYLTSFITEKIYAQL